MSHNDENIADKIQKIKIVENKSEQKKSNQRERQNSFLSFGQGIKSDTQNSQNSFLRSSINE